MSEKKSAPPQEAPLESPASPWWQMALFLLAIVVLIVRAPYMAASLGFLGLVIMAHEFGHFIVARWQGMRVETFSVGFGPALVKVEFGGTTYQVAPILVGGYMKPAGENPESDEEIANAKPDEFNGRPWWSRALVALAGPLTNLVFPVVALFLVYACVGRLDPQGPPLVQTVFAKSGAQAAGILPGDLVIRLNGEQVNGMSQLAALVDKQSRLDLGRALTVDLLRKGKPLRLQVRTTLSVTPHPRWAFWLPDSGKYLMGVGVEASPPPFTTTLSAPEVMTPAEKAGFKAGDVVLSVDGAPLRDGYAFSALFAHAAHDPVPIVVDRQGSRLTLSAAKKQPLPDEFDPALVGLLGLDFEPADLNEAQRREPLALVPALEYAAVDTLSLGLIVVVSVKEMIFGHISARDSLGGPVAILRMASQQAQRGWDNLVELMCSISIMLGLMNLLPIPILDGSTLLFCVVEAVRGRPLRLKTQVVLQNIGLTLIGSLFALTFVNDLLRWAGH
jgi:regulator of sigma E protease